MRKERNKLKEAGIGPYLKNQESQTQSFSSQATAKVYKKDLLYYRPTGCCQDIFFI